MELFLNDVLVILAVFVVGAVGIFALLIGAAWADANRHQEK